MLNKINTAKSKLCPLQAFLVNSMLLISKHQPILMEKKKKKKANKLAFFTDLKNTK